MMKGIKIVLTNYPRLVMSQIVDGNLQLLNIEVYTEEIMKFLTPLFKKNFPLKYAETITENHTDQNEELWSLVPTDKSTT